MKLCIKGVLMPFILKSCASFKIAELQMNILCVTNKLRQENE